MGYRFKDPKHPRLIEGPETDLSVLGGMGVAKVRKAISRSASTDGDEMPGQAGHDGAQKIVALKRVVDAR